jgi:hypothetical protein
LLYGAATNADQFKGERRTAMTIRTNLRADSDNRAISMRRQIRTTATKGDRLELLVVRAGLRAGKRERRASKRS